MQLSKFEVKIRFEKEAFLPTWKGNALRGAFGAKLREVSCNCPKECSECLLMERCPYHYLFDPTPPADSQVLRKQGNISRPFVLEAPNLGKEKFEKNEEAKFHFTLFGRGMDYFPYFLVAIRNMGESGWGKGYKRGFGKFSITGMKAVDDLNRKKLSVYEDGTVLNRDLKISYEEILRKSKAYSGDLKLIFTTPTQIKENGIYITAPEFRTLMSRLLFRINVISEFHGEGTLYDGEKVREILDDCDDVRLIKRTVNAIDYMQRYSKEQGKRIKIPTFFVGELVYDGEFIRDVIAILELGRFTHIGKLSTFGCGKYEVM